MRETGSSLLLCCWAGSVCLWPVPGLNRTGPPPLGPCLLFACYFYCFAICTSSVADYTFFLHYFFLSYVNLFFKLGHFFNTKITHAKNCIMHLISLFGVSKFYYLHSKFFWINMHCVVSSLIIISCILFFGLA